MMYLFPKEEQKPSNKNEYFYFFDFIKKCPDIKALPKIEMLPCVYKKR